MFGIGHGELIVLLLVVLLVFGAKRIPEMAQGLGKGIREFRKAMHEVQSEIDLNAPAESTSSQRLAAAGPSGSQQAKPQAAAAESQDAPRTLPNDKPA